MEYLTMAKKSYFQEINYIIHTWSFSVINPTQNACKNTLQSKLHFKNVALRNNLYQEITLLVWFLHYITTSFIALFWKHFKCRKRLDTKIRKELWLLRVSMSKGIFFPLYLIELINKYRNPFRFRIYTIEISMSRNST